MKQITILLKLIPAIACLISFGMLNAQTSREMVRGVVIDEFNEPLVGVTIVLEGTSTGTVTNLDGRFSLALSKGKNTIKVSYIGYKTQMIDVDKEELRIKLEPLSQSLTEVVVVGYGTQKKKDLTGSVATIGDKDFNEGLISSPEQLVNGKIAGVQIINGGGSPTSGSTIRIRGGASLNASNDPLIVLDGVPMEVGGTVSGSGNLLSLINPNDIESMTILKDASSTAIYGSRASNGVIIITTKKGKGDKVKVNFSTTNSVQTRTATADMLSKDEFINIVSNRGTEAQRLLLGSASTDWNDQVFTTALGTDNSLSLMGRITNTLPFRVSLGYYNQDGILKTDNATRYTGSLSLSPTFFDEHLRFNFNAKGTLGKNRFANTSAIWGGATHNPTIPVYSGMETFGGYNEAVDAKGMPITGATGNPLGLLKNYKSTSKVYRFIGNADVDYSMHFLPELRFHATLGYDYSKGQGDIYVPAYAYQYYNTGGRNYSYGPQENHNKLFTTYLNYNKEFSAIKSVLDLTLGYDYQYWKYTNAFYEELNCNGDVQASSAPDDQRHVLISYYGRVNFSYDSRYLLTATIRRDGSSRFSPQNRWGAFPSVALAWRISNEPFFKLNNVVNDLKLRVSYGKTGQQDGIANYSYIPLYTLSQPGASYMFGGLPIATYRPQAYNETLKWETTDSYNIGFDIALLENRISASFDYYQRKTKDLLATVPSAAGTNFNKQILTNVGNTESKGFEFSINATPVQTKDFTWTVSANATWQKNKITNLTLVEGAEKTNTLAGPYIDSYQMQVLTEGYAPYSFYVYKQIYDETTGKPIENLYADLNGDGVSDSKDLYRYHSPSPDWFVGFSTSLQYKKWTLSTSLRGSIGNYVYNGMAMNTGAWSTMSYNAFQLNNLHSSYLKTGFVDRQYLSDHYVENASFIKMDNLSLAYNFGNITKWCKLNASVMVQNVFTITKYSGVDPEVANGVDTSVYPRPRIYSISLGFEF